MAVQPKSQTMSLRALDRFEVDEPRDAYIAYIKKWEHT